MRRFWISRPAWLFGFLSGLIVGLVLFHSGAQQQIGRKHSAAPHSTPRGIQAPAKSHVKENLHFASLKRLKENIRPL